MDAVSNANGINPRRLRGLRSIRSAFGQVVDFHGSYRPDIDGLRAIAVLAVVAFHYGPSFVPSGFLGVDVFFVISGYLITGILLDGIGGARHRSFGALLSDFYQRRVRRIFPALILVLAVCLAVGWVFLFAFEFQRLGKHVAAGAGYVENFVLWWEAGYFDTESITKPLLQLWSLAVEEQFYIVWPLVLWLLVRFRWSLVSAISLIAMASFALNVALVTSGQATHAFYLPAARAWELMAGALLIVLQRRWPGRMKKLGGRLTAWLGAALLAAGLLLLNSRRDFPGFWALLPVLGTAALIHAGSASVLNRKLLAWRPLVWVGLISYPLYLWHWSLLSLFKVVLGDIGHGRAQLAGIVLAGLSFVLAWGTYRYIERPIRARHQLRVSLGLLALVTALGLAGLATHVGAGFPQRALSLANARAAPYLQDIQHSAFRDQALRDRCYDLYEQLDWPRRWHCVVGDAAAKTRILVLGDSHSFAMLPAFDRYGRSKQVRVVYAGQSSCLSLLGVYKYKLGSSAQSIACMMQANRAAELAARIPLAGVVFVQRWTQSGVRGTTRPEETKPIQAATLRDGVLEKGRAKGVDAFKQALERTLTFYASKGIPVLLVQDNPQQADRISTQVARMRFARGAMDDVLNAGAVTRTEHRRDQARVNAILEAAVARHPASRLLNIDSALCNATICPWVKDGRFLYFNDDHLSRAGAMQVYPLLARELDDMLRPEAAGTP